MTDIPTKEQEREFWERCGWTNKVLEDGTEVCELGREMPCLDLNNLFKYAVPKLHDKYKLLYLNFDAPFHDDEIEDTWLCKISSDYPDSKFQVLKEGKSPALALFWAIWEVIHG